MTANINMTQVAKEISFSDEFLSNQTGNSFNDFLRNANQMIIYDPSVINLTIGADLFRSIFEAITTSKTAYMFRFLINPTVLDYGLNKIVTPVLEKKGWDTIHWPDTPNEMIPMSFSGTTGTLLPIKILREAGVRDTKFSAAWQRFQQFKNLIHDADGDLKMLYDGVLYEGYVSNFKFKEDANTPYGIVYSFIFNAFPDRIVNIAAPNNLFRRLPVIGTTLANSINSVFNTGIAT